MNRSAAATIVTVLVACHSGQPAASSVTPPVVQAGGNDTVQFCSLPTVDTSGWVRTPVSGAPVSLLLPPGYAVSQAPSDAESEAQWHAAAAPPLGGKLSLWIWPATAPASEGRRSNWLGEPTPCGYKGSTSDSFTLGARCSHPRGGFGRCRALVGGDSVWIEWGQRNSFAGLGSFVVSVALPLPRDSVVLLQAETDDRAEVEPLRRVLQSVTYD